MADFDFGAQSAAEESALQQAQDNWRKNQAMNALVRVYGPEAGDPTATAQVQENALNAQMNPLKVQEGQRQNAAGNALVSQFGPQAGNPEAMAKTTEASAAQGEQQAFGQSRVIQALASVPVEQRGALFDSLVVPNAQAWGIDPAHLPTTRAMLTNPAISDDTLNHISQSLTSMHAKMVGAPVVGFDSNTGQSVLIKGDQFGGSHVQPLGSGVTPVSQQRAGTAQETADTGLLRQQVAQANATYGPTSPQAQAAAARLGQAVAGQAIQTTESGNNPNAVNAKSGAAGLMQLKPETVANPGFGIAPAKDDSPGENQRVGQQYYSALSHKYGNPTQALAAYNWGPGNVDKWIAAGADPNKLPQETQAYIGKVAMNAQKLGGINGLFGPAAAAAAQPGATPIVGNAAFQALPEKGRVQTIGQAQHLADQGSNLKTVSQVLDQVDQQISPFTAGAGSLIKDLPGTAQANLKANLATLSAQGLTAWIQSLKNAQGQTGVGRVLQSEANAAMKLYGNMEQDQTAKQLAFHSQLFRTAVTNLYNHARQGFKTTWGAEPEEILNGRPNPPGTTANGGGGKTYTFDPKTGTLQ